MAMLAIEMDDRNPSRYGKIHKKGCRDLRDPETIGEATDRDTANRLADDITGWGPDYGEVYEYGYAPCTGL
jgi:hypothetical protein